MATILIKTTVADVLKQLNPDGFMSGKLIPSNFDNGENNVIQVLEREGFEVTYNWDATKRNENPWRIVGHPVDVRYNHRVWLSYEVPGMKVRGHKVLKERNAPKWPELITNYEEPEL
jgi:hypothetical protein